MLYADRGYWIAHLHSRTKKDLGRAYRRSGGRDDQAKEEIAALLSAPVLVVLEAASWLYVLGGSGERREPRGMERHSAGAPGSGGRDERGRRSPFLLVPRRLS